MYYQNLARSFGLPGVRINHTLKDQSGNPIVAVRDKNGIEFSPANFEALIREAEGNLKKGVDAFPTRPGIKFDVKVSPFVSQLTGGIDRRKLFQFVLAHESEEDPGKTEEEETMDGFVKEMGIHPALLPFLMGRR